MTYGDLRAFTQPFRPFRVVQNNGTTFDVCQRGGFILSHMSLEVDLLKSGTDEYERVAWIDLAQIVHIEPLPPASPLQGNGQQGG